MMSVDYGYFQSRMPRGTAPLLACDVGQQWLTVTP